MTVEQQVASAPTSRDAMLVIARALDRLLAPQPPVAPRPAWEDWGIGATTTNDLGITAAYDAQAPAYDVVSDEDHTEITIVPVSPERQEQRRMFEAQVLHLSEYLGDAEDWASAYAAGGPLYLYIANRELVMSYPDSIKRAFVEDVEQDDPQAAREMARDILKAPADQTGYGNSPPMADLEPR